MSLVLASAGCIGSDPVVGEWSSSPLLSAYFTLNNDGTGTYSCRAEQNVPLTWEKSGDRAYNIILYGEAMPGILSADGNTLLLIGDIISMTLTRN